MKHYCSECEKETPHAVVVQIKQGSVTKGLECLECGNVQEDKDDEAA